jgi:hypothetical protein
MWRTGCLAIVWGLLPLAAFAQAFEGAAGYHVTDYRDLTLQPVGWFVATAARPANASWFAVAGEVTGEYASERVGSRDVRRRAFTFVTGPRLVYGARFGVFFETLLGVAHDREFLTERSVANHFVVQPGAGADVELTDHLAARFHVAFRMQSFDSWFARRFAAGLVVKSKRPQQPAAKPKGQ